MELTVNDLTATTLPYAIPDKAKDQKHWGQCSLTALARIVAQWPALSEPLLLITPSVNEALQLQRAIQWFSNQTQNVVHFPDWETLAYDHFSPTQNIVSERLTVLQQLSQNQNIIVTVAAPTLINKLSPTVFINSNVWQYRAGDILDATILRQQLTQAGYTAVSQVGSRREFAIRGSIIDVFPMGSKQPVRFDLFDNEIESIRFFDIETQRSLETIAELDILPAHEFPLDSQAQQQFENNWENQFNGRSLNSPILSAVKNGHSTPGLEYYLPLFFENNETASLFDYLPHHSTVIEYNQALKTIELEWEEIQKRYQAFSHNIERPLLKPEQLFWNSHQLQAQRNQHPQLYVSAESLSKTHAGRVNIPQKRIPDITTQPRHKMPLIKLQHFLANTTRPVFFATESLGRRELILEQLKRHGIEPVICDNYAQFLTHNITLGIGVSPVAESDYLDIDPCYFITESALFARRHFDQKSSTQSAQHEPGIVVKDLSELMIGGAVVHLEHGVGRYQGLTLLDMNDDNQEMLTIEYADQAKLYVPINDLHLISRYSGAELENAPLHKLGSDQWEKAKQKAAKRIRDVAAELLDIYAKRAARTGHRFPESKTAFAQFSNGFPFQETPDQDAAITAIVDDMTSDRPMDRLLCGDVGFGKTEVAMRAAFLSVHAGKQIALLAPTTLLVQQHVDTFSTRFSEWPVTIRSLSRFSTAKETKQTLLELKTGKIDIIIGTHKLLSDQISFKDLGLIIIDEEHRFGVRHKEKLRQLRAEVDILAMTATPIPRTLNMALSHIRDISIIATPPARRLPVKTLITEANKQLITDAIQREIHRGGQVFYLHNDVRTIHHAQEELKQWLPNVNFGIGHGQLPERALEQVMNDFYHNRFQVLICTTIIETGIDIPNANTIIIERADKFGLAQLHQLRGRVGRSTHQAFAYLLSPPFKTLTSDAKKRLNAIESATELGSGFNLASHDLEIRGAGEILGDQQSGNVHAIGMGLYLELLDKTVKAMQSGKELDLDQAIEHTGCQVELHSSVLLPEDYCPDVHTRLGFYKRIAQAQSESELDTIQIELIDRFGLLPDIAKRVFAIAEIKIKANKLNIDKIDVHSQGGRIIFNAKTTVDPFKIIQLIQSYPSHYRFDGQDTLRLLKTAELFEERVSAINTVFDRLKK